MFYEILASFTQWDDCLLGLTDQGQPPYFTPAYGDQPSSAPIYPAPLCYTTCPKSQDWSLLIFSPVVSWHVISPSGIKGLCA